MFTVIYTATAFWNAHLDNGFGRYPLWIAHYTGAATPAPLPEGWTDWTFWQYSQSLTINGVNGPADHDYFDGAAADLQALTAK